MPPGIRLRHAVGSNRGPRPATNGDSAYAGAHLLAVADGGEDRAGASIAADTAIAPLRALDAGLPGLLGEPHDTRSPVPPRSPFATDPLAERLAALLGDAFQTADAHLRDRIETDPALQGMGTTLTALLHWEGRLVLTSVGDSPFYRLRGNEIFQDGHHDPTLIQSLLDENRISPQEAGLHQQYSSILEGGPGLRPYTSRWDVMPGDRYLLGTGGLTGAVPTRSVYEALLASPTPADAVRRLLDLAPDDTTCVVADAVPSEG
ncbi:PP2C family serine/threonine-protein phosphatase [Actinocorallia aurantiaca]|uniref:PPM-type phosphatase domain-containing protein n=1 Tax=Actinocorallia aurantiaca TaxID=46204 RepID=A0ABN3U193_9ACTN